MYSSGKWWWKLVALITMILGTGKDIMATELGKSGDPVHPNRKSLETKYFIALDNGRDEFDEVESVREGQSFTMVKQSLKIPYPSFRKDSLRTTFEKNTWKWFYKTCKKISPKLAQTSGIFWQRNLIYVKESEIHSRISDGYLSPRQIIEEHQDNLQKFAKQLLRNLKNQWKSFWMFRFNRKENWKLEMLKDLKTS